MNGLYLHCKAICLGVKMNSANLRYGKRSNGRHHGDVFTSPEIVCFILDTVGYTSDRDLSKFYILEPSFGSGEFLMEIQRRIIESSAKYGFDAVKAFQSCVYGCEIDSEKYHSCVSRLCGEMSVSELPNLKNEDFLFLDLDVRFDFVVGNPPYVRYENIPHAARDLYRARFKTFHYRCDLYVLFYEHSLKLLANGGKHCFICSNRWLKNEYGKKLRSLIVGSYNLERLVDVEQLNAFQESVLAYPVISVVTNTANSFNVMTARVDDMAGLKNNLQYQERRYESVDNFDAIFSSAPRHELSTIEEQNFAIGIGVATGADSVFISASLLDTVETEVVVPIVNARDLTGNKFVWGGRFLLNPYDENGGLINLNNYPKAKLYLENHRTILQKRHIVKNNRCWYALIDKVKPGLRRKPKILLPDISANAYIFVDDGLYYPSHNLYYITAKDRNKKSLMILAAILMSDFVREQVVRFSNTMNGGFPRWQSQVLKKLRIPEIDRIPSVYKKSILNAYCNFDIKEINRLVDDVLKLPCETWRQV